MPTTGFDPEIVRLRHQAAEARQRADELLAQREAALCGTGLMPSEAEVQRAQAMAETAEPLKTAERTARHG